MKIHQNTNRNMHDLFDFFQFFPSSFNFLVQILSQSGTLDEMVAGCWHQVAARLGNIKSMNLWVIPCEGAHAVERYLLI
jgi:hypothetical protein